MRTYHVAWYQHGSTARLQVRVSIDSLSCEALEYLGERITTKSKVRALWPAHKVAVLADLQARYPHRGIQAVTLDL